MSVVSASPRRVAASWVARIGGVIQAPPAMVEAVSKWVVSTVAVTSKEKVEVDLKGYEDQVRERPRLPLVAALKAYQTGKASKLGVRALWAFVDPTKTGTLANLALTTTGSLGWELFGSSYTFTVFSKDFKEGGPSLQRRITSLEEFIAGTDAYTVSVKRRYHEDLARLDRYIFPGVDVAPLRSGEATREFDLMDHLDGWRYTKLISDPAYLAESQILQLRKKQREIQKQISVMNTQYLRKKTLSPQQTAGIQGIIEDFEKIVSRNDDLIKDLSSGGKPTFTKVKVILTLTTNTLAKASWHPHERLVTVYYPAASENWNLDDLRESVRHELQHLSQTILQESLRVPSAGLPEAKILTPQYQQWMSDPKKLVESPYLQQRLDKVMQDLDEQGLVNTDLGYGRVLKRKPKDFDFHALDDIEFFTRTQDAIERFRKLLPSGLPRETKNNAMDLFTGKIEMPGLSNPKWHDEMEALGGYEALRAFELDYFFKELRRVPKARMKYDRAVKELRREFGYTGKMR